MSHRTQPTTRRQSLLSTIRTGLNQFEEVSFRTVSAHKTRNRFKTAPSGEVEEMLKTKREQCQQIQHELRNQRQIQLLDFVKKSLKYQELLNINDNKKKRLPTLNSKVGEVVKVSVNLNQQHNVSYTLETKMLSLHHSTPPTREGHTTLIYYHTAIVIGGHCSSPFATGHIYSFTSNTWTKQFPLPSARSYHSTVLYKDRYGIVFGGMGAYDVSRKCRVCYNSVNLIDLHTLSARVLKMTGEQLVEGRRSHGCALMGKYMLILGGINTRRGFLKDFLYLDLKQLRWYQKEYRIQSRQLIQDMEKGIARHKAVAHFREGHKTLPLYSSEYSDLEGLYFFGGSFGAGSDNILLFMALNTYNPCLRRVTYAGSPPSSVHTQVEKINDNLIVIISGEIDNRGLKIYKIKEKEFMGVTRYMSSPYFGGMGSSLSRYQDGLLLLFGLSQGGYNSEVVTLNIIEQERSIADHEERLRKDDHLDWKIWQKLSFSESSNNIE